MKKFTLGITLLATATGSAFAAPLLSNDFIQTNFTLNAKVRYDDNILLTATGDKSDTIYEFDPGVKFNLGNKDKPGLLQLSATEAVQRYDKATSLNSNLISYNLNSNLGTASGDKTTATVSAGYSQIAANTPGTLANPTILSRRNVTDAGAGANYKFSGLTDFTLAGQYEYTEYKAASSVNSRVYTVPFNYYYTPDSSKIDLSAGLQYRKTDLKSVTTPGYTDYYYNVGLRSTPVSTKISGSLSVGLNQRDTPNAKTEYSPGVKGNLSYKYTDKTTFTLGASNDFGASSGGQSQKIVSINGGVQTNFNEQWSASLDLSYSRTKFATVPPRTDGLHNASLGVTYVATKWCSIRLADAYADNTSNVGAYKDNTVSLTAVLNY